jgi:hypothetical protein
MARAIQLPFLVPTLTPAYASCQGKNGENAAQMVKMLAFSIVTGTVLSFHW